VTKSFAFGRTIFATSMAGLGVQCLLRGSAVPALEPVLTSAAHPAIGWITGVVLVAAAVATMARPTAHYGALVLAALLLLWVALLHIPALSAAPRNGGEWTGALETLALGGAAILLFGLTTFAAGYERAPDPLAIRCTLIGRLLYGIAMPGFGALHFIYIAYVASVIPAWLPAHVAFGYATGVAHVASGFSILSGVLTRIAAFCTAAMFGSWVVILHLPRVVVHMRDPNEWTSMLIAVGMCGGALLIADSVSNIPATPDIAGEARAHIPVRDSQ
jgi:hypothetical protein